MAETAGAQAWGTPKPRFRITTDGVVKSMDGVSIPTGDGYATGDSYTNFLASIGMQTRNLSAGSTYQFRLITRERVLLEMMYRGSWICGVACDSVADDMTKLGVDFGGSLPPVDAERLSAALLNTGIWSSLNELIKWGRLYGGAIAVIMIDGQDPKEPLRLDSIGPGQFQGLVVLDRWMVEPSLNDLVTDPGPDIGYPKYYKVTSGVAPVGAAIAPAILGNMIHYSRCFRYTGVDLPWWQRITENMWGMSIFERLWDRLTAFDSTTQGVAQLVYRAYLRVIKLADLRQAASLNPEAQQGLAKRIDLMTRFQTNEGMTLISDEDSFEAVTYSFLGLDTVLVQMGQQLSGALQIPLVRLFGQAPIGMNATGDSDIRLFYDGLHQQQETRLRRPLTRAIKCVAASERIRLPDTFHFAFNSLWQLLPKEKADLAEVVTRTVLSAEELGLISEKRVLEELRQQARETGIFATITDQEIAAADDQAAPPAPAMPGGAEHQMETGQGETERSETPGGLSERSLPVPKPTIHLGTGGSGGGSLSNGAG